MESILKRWWFGGGAEEAGPLRTALRAFQPPASCFGQGQFCDVLPVSSCSAWNLVQNPLNWLNKMGKTTPESLLRPVCDTGHGEQDVNRVQRITRACRGCCGRPGFDDKNWMDFCSDFKGFLVRAWWTWRVIFSSHRASIQLDFQRYRRDSLWNFGALVKFRAFAGRCGNCLCEAWDLRDDYLFRGVGMFRGWLMMPIGGVQMAEKCMQMMWCQIWLTQKPSL